MRPEIPEELEQRINEVCWKAGYQTTGEFVREATRRHVTELQNESRHGTKGHLVFQDEELSDEHHRIPVEFRLVMSREGVTFADARVTVVDHGYNWFDEEDMERVEEHLKQGGSVKLSLEKLGREFNVDPQLTWKKVNGPHHSVTGVEIDSSTSWR